jgi:3-hydroxypropanoate dehydrogenase
MTSHAALATSAASASAAPGRLDAAAVDLLFHDARTHSVWNGQPVSDEELRLIYEQARMGPTSRNSSPLRIVFVRSTEAKARLLPAVAPPNVEKVTSAPVTAIFAYDSQFHEEMLKLHPQKDTRPIFAQMPEERRLKMAEQSALLQAGYAILAARGLGLDVGPMGGFDAAKVNETFFPDGRWRAMILVNLGHGDASRLSPRNPRLSFEEAARIE